MLASSFYESGLFIDTNKRCSFRCTEKNFCGGVWDPTKVLVEVWDYAQISQDVIAYSVGAGVLVAGLAIFAYATRNQKS